MYRTILMAIILIALSGCKLAVILVEGGEVQSTASGTCWIQIPGTGTACIHQVTDTSYSESFTAVPNEGWKFVRWNSGGNFMCEDSTNPVCLLTFIVGAGVPRVEAIVASDLTFYIMPIFEIDGEDPNDGESITDTINAPDGNEWAQVDLFDGLTYSQIAVACPGGACSGTLNGFAMAGWSWASAQEVLDLFNSYEATGFIVVPVPASNFASSTIVPSMNAAGFNTSGEGAIPVPQIGGYTSSAEPISFATLVDLNDLLPGETGILVGSSAIATPSGDSNGGWFYR